MPSCPPLDPARSTRAACLASRAASNLPQLALLALVTVLAVPVGAGAKEATVRWKLEPTEGLLYDLRGPGAKALGDGGVARRTLYGADLLDARVPREPVGRVKELVFHYLFQLPEEPVGRTFERDVDDRHSSFGRTTGPVRAVGKLQASLRGQKLTTRWELKLEARAQPAPNRGRSAPTFSGGRLVVEGVFHRKKGVMLRGSFDLTHTSRGKPVHLVGTVALSDRVALSAPAFRRRVDQAIQRALKKVLQPALARKGGGRRTGNPMGQLALVLYASVHAGLSPRSKVAQAAYQQLATLPPKTTYSVSLAILALEARSFQRVRSPRGRSGTTVSRFRKGDIPKSDRARMEQLVKWLLQSRNAGQGTWTYKPRKPGEQRRGLYGDHSNTQFAILALHAAQRSGVEVPRAVWEEIARHFVKVQMRGGPYDADLVFEDDALLAASEDDEGAGGKRSGAGTRGRRGTGGARERAPRARGFDYGTQGGWNAYASMSAAGTSSLAIAYRWLRAVLSADDWLLARTRRGAMDGLRWLAKHHTMRHNWPDRSWPFYHLYSLEKAFEIPGVVRLDGHDWWAEGSEELLLREAPGGGWGEGDTVHTALAVLFLTRATREPELSIEKLVRKTTGGGAATDDAPDAVLVEGVGVVRVREVVRALAVEDPRRRKDRLSLLARAFEVLELDRRPLLIPGLAKHLGGRFSDVRQKARSYLKEIIGQRVKSATEALAVHAEWKRAVSLGEARDPIAIPELRPMLREAESPAVRRALVRSLSQLRAIEATGDLFSELARGDEAYRRLVAAVLGQLVGEEAGYDAGATRTAREEAVTRWRAVWESRRQTLFAHEELLRLVAALGVRERAQDAAKRLEARGETAIGPLIDVLGHEAAYGSARRRDYHASVLLGKLTGLEHGPDRSFWDAWRKRTGRGL